jgi:hypothetical protein
MNPALGLLPDTSFAIHSEPGNSVLRLLRDSCAILDISPFNKDQGNLAQLPAC